MKVVKVVEIKRHYKVMVDETQDSLAYGEIGRSYSIVEIYDDNTRKTHFAIGEGDSHIIDMLPGGTSYLADDFAEAIKELEKKYTWK
jgi:hypothetical protein